MGTPDIYHPVADIFPMMKGQPFEELCADIAVNGLREEIWRHEGKIIDGRNRYQACLHVGVTPQYREWDGKGDLVAFVLSLNLHRRHLSESQRAMVAAKIANLGEGNPDLKAKNSTTPIGVVGVSQSDAAKMLNVSTQSVTRAKKVKDHGVPELVEAVERGDVSVAAAADVAEVEPERQKKVVAGGADTIMAEARKVRFEDRRLKQVTAEPEVSEMEGRTFVVGARMTELGAMIEELVELANRPDHRYPFIQIKSKMAALSEAYSRIVGRKKRTA